MDTEADCISHGASTLGKDMNPIILPHIYIYIYIYIYREREREEGIKLGQFTQEGLDSVRRKNKNKKEAGLNEIPPEVWKTREFDNILLRHCNAVYNLKQ